MVNLGAGDAAAHADVDFDADGDYAYSPSEASECWPLDPQPQSHGETEEAGESAHQRTNPQPMPGGTNPQPMPRSTNPQPMPRGGNEEVGEDGRMFTVLRGSGGKVAGYSLKCKWHRGEDCVRDCSLGTINPMTRQECQLRLLRWEKEGKDLPALHARAAHKDLGSMQLLANFASCGT